jgi:acyl carrier protein
MTEDLLSEKLALLIANSLDKEVDPSNLDARLVEDYGATSMDFVDIVMRAEKVFHLKITNEQMKQLETFGSLLSLIKAQSTLSPPSDVNS